MRRAWLLGALALACGDPSHVYAGRAYLDARDCLGPVTSIDVVEGKPAGNCGPACLAQPHPDGGRTLYVATMCAPYPFMFDTSGADPACSAALAASARSDSCNADGTSTHPVAPDAGGD